MVPENSSPVKARVDGRRSVGVAASVPVLVYALILALSAALAASSQAAGLPPELGAWLSFEAGANGALPAGWAGGPPGTLFYESEVVKTGDGAARVTRDATSGGEFSSLSRGLDIDFGGEKIEIRGVLKTEGVVEWAGFWLRLDGRAGPVQFRNMEDAAIRGDTPWTEYSMELPLDPKAERMSFGVLLAGEGTVWVDDLEFFVDGKPLAEAPERVREKTVLDRDVEFAAGSAVELAAPATAFQVETLTLTARIWGFLKYHHPRIAGGELHWDFELFRVLPDLLAA
ncbi:MAG: hypothetical protein AAGF23_23975, partial [Acidobacteriota bacterium]